MKQKVSYSLVVSALAAATLQTQSQELRLGGVQRLANGQVQVTANGSSVGAVNLEGSADFQNWTKLQTFPAASPISYNENPASGRSFYRLTIGATVSNPPPVGATLSDLSTLPNRVFSAPEGLNTVQYAANGNLAYVFWQDKSLVIRERTSAGWSENVLNNAGNTFSMLTTFDFSGPRSDYNFQPSVGLVYDSQSRPHVFQASGTTIVHYAKNGVGAWSEAERINDSQANANIAVLEVGIGAGDVIHFAALSAGAPRNLTYGSNRGGSWNWTTISQVSDADPYYWAPPFAPRWLGMAVDGNNRAHIVYRSSMDITRDSAGHPRAYSIVKYASNASGSWVTDQVVQRPFDVSGEAANGASIAVGPDGAPVIVSWYDERADSGSAEESRLYIHRPLGGGSWSSDIIFQTADGYVAGDGNKGTGFSPQLRFDSTGRMHLVFLDHAGEHFSNVGQQEYAGNLRHAWLSGGSWQIETLYRQTNPLQQQVVYPAFAMSGNEMTVTFMDRNAVFNLNSYPPLPTSETYTFRVLTTPLK